MRISDQTTAVIVGGGGGIGRGTALGLVEKGARVVIADIDLETATAVADEVFLSTTGGGVVPVTKVDGRIFSNGAPGPVVSQLRETYHDWRMQPRFREEVAYPG